MDDLKDDRNNIINKGVIKILEYQLIAPSNSSYSAIE